MALLYIGAERTGLEVQPTQESEAVSIAGQGALSNCPHRQTEFAYPSPVTPSSMPWVSSSTGMERGFHLGRR
jgi:hypothetical protein